MQDSAATGCARLPIRMAWNSSGLWVRSGAGPVPTGSRVEAIGGVQTLWHERKNLADSPGADDRLLQRPGRMGDSGNRVIDRRQIRNHDEQCADRQPAIQDMKAAHAGMQITEAEWNATVENLGKALDKNKVGAAEKKELVGALGPMKSDIVGQ